jgi:ornithine cyclodeaminase/alanine dehydrogenase-like protein (mu-crystallin family)
MKIVRPSLKECRISAKTIEEEEQFIRELSPLLTDMTFVSAKTVARDAMNGADILVTATSAQAPLLKAEWMKPGAFYSHIGGWEDEYKVALQCDKIVCDDWETVTHRTQTLSKMYAEGLLSHNDIYADLHELVSGDKPGRESDDERTYFNAVGLAYVDVAIALAMFKRAESLHIGQQLDLQETMVFEHKDIISRIRM